MNSLELTIQQALDSKGDQQAANKAYLEFIKANFLIPIDKNSVAEQPEVVYLQQNNEFFLPVFTDRQYFDHWAHKIHDVINILHLTGVNLLKGIGEQVTICLNLGSNIYKEFNPAELNRMKSMVLKLFKN